ncbi:MAG: zinc-dependent alcohol dehydrogenase family protein [Desulfomonilia bacterium]|nr:zinc-dependent alcohol dehydrogenase family protein [Desulfomonilia bacterium]
MKAMVLTKIQDLEITDQPLDILEMPEPVPGDREVLIKVSACGVCHTELDEIEGRTAPPRFPIVPGHQVIGTVVEAGKFAQRFSPGDRVGVGWIFSSCGSCEFCLRGQDNLCPEFMATGRDAYGGYAQFMTVPEHSAFLIPEVFSDVQAAPLLCAGAIGYRSLRLTGIGNGQRLGLTGFGASAHLVLKMVMHLYPSSRVYVFARSEKEREFARELGAFWAGDTADRPPENLHSIIDTTPAWKPIVTAMKNLLPGGRLVINAIRKEENDKDELLRLDYPEHLWMEKEIKSVANVARADIREFLELAAEIPLMPEVQEYSLEDANTALLELKQRRIRGAKVLMMS